MYYFAYGSNMNWEQMQRRCPSAKFVCVARLTDYRFAIARHSRLRKCGTANLLAESGCVVWGVVYEVDDHDMKLLDGFEDGYRRQNVSVHAQDDGRLPLEVLTYIAVAEELPPLPNPEYKRLILDGARHWNIPHDYLAMLEKIETHR